MKQIIAFIMVGLACLFSGGAMALTKQDCRERVNNAMHNSDMLGGNDADAYRWAQNAANECFKEIASSRSNNSYDSNNSTSNSFDASAIFLPLAILGLVGYFIVWPLFSGFTEGMQKVNNEQIASFKVDAPTKLDEIDEEIKSTQQLRAEIIGKIKEMTISEIDVYTKSTRRGTIAWLRRNDLSCKDYDGRIQV